MQEQVFEKMTPEHFEALSTLVRSETGIEMRGNSGEAGHNGYELKWSYEGNTLRMQCTKRPWLFPEAVVESGISRLVGMSDPKRPADVDPGEAVGGSVAPEGSTAVDTGGAENGANIEKDPVV